MIWFIGVAVILFLSIRVLMLSDTVRKHERWIKILNKEIKLLKETMDTSESVEYSTSLPPQNEEEILPKETVDQVASSMKSVRKSSKRSAVTKQKIERKAPAFDMTKITIESVISKLGIGLVLVGLGFLFKYAYDRGMITEQLTVVIGYIIGLILYSLGFAVKRKNREMLSQVLIGGSIAAFYITTYAAHLAYGMFGQVLAFGILSVITAWAFLSSVYLKAQSVSVIAVIGGLLVPFLAKIDFIGLRGIGIYIGIVALGAMLVHFFHRWRVLQISSIVSVYAAIYLMIDQYSMSTTEAWMVFTLMIYLLLVHSAPDILSFLGERTDDKNSDSTVFVLGGVPVLTLVFTESFELASSSIQAVVFALAALLYAAVFLISERKGLKGHVQVILAFLSGAFAAYASILYFDGVTRPVVVLAVGLLFYYGSTKLSTKCLPLIGHMVSVIGLGLASYELFLAYDSSAAVGDYLGHGAAILILIIGALLNSGISRKVMGSTALQIYGFALIELIIKTEVPKELFVFGSMIALGVWLVTLQIVKEKLALLPKYGIEVYSLLVLLSKAVLAFESAADFKVEVNESIAGVVLVILLYGLAHFRYSDEKSRASLKAVALSTLVITAVVDIWILTDYIQYGVAAAGLIVLLYKMFDQDKDKASDLIKDIASYVWFILVLISGWSGLDSYAFSMMILIASVVQLVIFYKLLSLMEHSNEIEFIVYSVVFFLVSYSALTGLNNADGSITLTWAAYSLFRLALHMMKGQKKLAYYALGLIVFVVGKYIVIDISTVSVIWKVITSMIFGAALLILSYMMQPLIDRFNKE